MIEFKIYNCNMNEIGEDESIVRACKIAYENKGFVGVVDFETGNIKEIIQGENIKYIAKSIDFKQGK